MNRLRRLFVFALLLGAATAAWASRTVTDESGRRVTLPDHARRIVCLAPSIADSLFNLGAADQVVGVTQYTAYPAAARRKPSIGELLRPSLERIAVLHPDVAIGVVNWTSADTVRGLERMGIPVYLVANSGLAAMYNSLANLGRIAGREREAAALIARLRQREQRVRQQFAHTPHPAVFLAISLDPCITMGRRAFLTELLEAAGAYSVTAELPQEWIDLNIEAILPRRPQYVLVFANAPFGVRQMQQHAGWRSLDAVRAGRVLRIDDRLQYPSPVALDALENLAQQLHPAH